MKDLIFSGRVFLSEAFTEDLNFSATTGFFSFHEICLLGDVQSQKFMFSFLRVAVLKSLAIVIVISSQPMSRCI